MDIFCLGLKAARVEKDYTMEEFRRNVLEGAPAEVELARRLVAGGIRFARVHHFKLPAHYDRYVSLLGDLGEIDAADVSDFGVNGKLRFIGELDELGRRLIGVSPKEFISRQDVEYIAMMGKSELGDSELRGNSDVESEFGKEAEDFFDAVAEAAEDIAAEVEEWCKANGRLPSPFLQNAAEVVLTSGYIAREEDSPRIDFNRRVTELINQSMESLPFYLRAEADSAVEQLQLFLSSKAATVVSDAKSQDKGRLRYVESDMYQK
ncbi:MAG: hypothetical protein IPK83_13310 [Planctomycetes bacterium]|nr:hypothetical protein [Planctomycetota bacterium]